MGIIASIMVRDMANVTSVDLLNLDITSLVPVGHLVNVQLEWNAVMED